MKNLRKLRILDNPGVKEEGEEEYTKLLEYLDGTVLFMKQRTRGSRR
jgi:hypothetical protein